MAIPLQELMQDPYVQELVEQNAMMAEALPESDFSTGKFASSLKLGKRKLDLENIKVPHIIKDRLLFQEGEHNDLFYSYRDIEKNYQQWENLSIFFAEHADASNHFVGVSQNVRLAPDEKAIYGDLEIVDKPLAQKLEYQIQRKNGKMGLSPTLDVDKQLSNGKYIAGSPWEVKSQSVVLDPAVRTTVFNSNDGGKKKMGDEETQQLKKDEVAISKEDLDVLKLQSKELQDYKKKELVKEVEELSALEVELGVYSEEELSSRKEILEKLSEAERKILSNTYKRLAQMLSDEDPEERFINSLPENLKGDMPPGLKKFLDEKRKKKADEGMARKKKEDDDEEDMAHDGAMPDDKKRKYPYPEKGQKLNNPEEQKLSKRYENLVLKKEHDFNRWQHLSQENRKSNEEFIDFLLKKQGDEPAFGGR